MPRDRRVSYEKTVSVSQLCMFGITNSLSMIRKICDASYARRNTYKVKCPAIDFLHVLEHDKKLSQGSSALQVETETAFSHDTVLTSNTTVPVPAALPLVDACGCTKVKEVAAPAALPAG